MNEKGKSQTGSKESKAPTLKTHIQKRPNNFSLPPLSEVSFLKTFPRDPTSRPFRPRNPHRPLQARRSPQNHFLHRFAAPRGTVTGRLKAFGESYVVARWACGMMRVVVKLAEVGARC